MAINNFDWYSFVQVWTTLMVMLTRLSTKDSCEMIAFAETLTSNLCRLLPVQSVDGVIESQPPRKVLDIVNAVWLKLSSVMPRYEYGQMFM